MEGGKGFGNLQKGLKTEYRKTKKLKIVLHRIMLKKSNFVTSAIPEIKSISLYNTYNSNLKNHFIYIQNCVAHITRLI
jgi:hypothetical protein